jgi:hypothetical protein
MNAHEILEALHNNIKIEKNMNDSGTTGYLDFLKDDFFKKEQFPGHYPVIKGEDPCGRKFIAIRLLWEGEPTNIVAHQRYSDQKNLWVLAGRNEVAHKMSVAEIKELEAHRVKDLIENRYVNFTFDGYSGKKHHYRVKLM